MITKQQLIEKMRDVAVNCENLEEATKVNDLIFKTLGIKLDNNIQYYKSETCYNINGGSGVSFADKEWYTNIGTRIIPATEFLSYFEEDKMTDREICEKIVKQGNCYGISCYRDKCPLSKKYGNSWCNNHRDCTEGAKQWIKYNTKQGAKMNIEEKDGDYTIQFKERTESKTEKISRKNYLLNRVKQIEANKKECIARMDSEIESLQKEMTSANCYVMEDGSYQFNKNNIYSDDALTESEFINSMEADFE